MVDSDESAMSAAGNADDVRVQWGPISVVNDRDHVVDPRLAFRDTANVNLDLLPRLVGVTAEEEEVMTPYDLFIHWLPVVWITTVMIPAMNAVLVNELAARRTADNHPITWPELQVVLGVLMYYAGQIMDNFDDLWSTTTDQFWRQTRHCVHRYISRDRCRLVMRCFGCLRPDEMDENHPLKGPLRMIDAFNERWAACFRPGHTVCMDESTMHSTSDNDPAKVRACAEMCVRAWKCV